MKAILATMLVAGTIGAAQAQDVPSITVRPLDDGSGGGGAYTGPYGPDLPGVAMFRGRATPASPVFAYGGVPLPSLRKRANEYTRSQSLLPVLDSYQGTLGDGFPF